MNAPADLRLPPHSIEAEQSLLGAMLLDSRSWDRIADAVSADDFYRDDHRRIFRHAALLAGRGIEFDVVTVWESIEKTNEKEQTGGLNYLSELANSTASTANIRRYAEIVRDRATMRRLIGVADELQAACFTPGQRQVEEIVAATEQRLLAEIDSHDDEPAALFDVLTDTLNYIDTRGDTSGLRTGFDDLDKLTGGLDPGQLIVVAARPSVGKTLFACNVADSVASSGTVLFMTLEMTRREICMRILAARSAVSVHAMRAGTKSNDAWDRMIKAVPAALGQRLYIDDKPAVGIPYIRARARRLQRKHGLQLIIIDYLGLMKGQGDNRVQEIGSISRGLKALAKELCIPILVLAQLNRSVESRPDKRPIMSDLRDSGEIEQDADIIAMLHREEIYNDDADWKGFAELILRKNRNGPLGDVNLSYDGRQMTFSPWPGDSPRQWAKKPAAKGFKE